MIENKPNKPIFFNPEPIGKRDFGEELLLVFSSGKYMMKKITMNAGTKGGLQFHREKDEADFVIEGSITIRFMDNGKLKEKTVHEGEAVRFAPGVIHQVEAITDAVLIEVSTPHINDRVRMEEMLGFESAGGLPTTNPEDIGTL